MTRFAQSIVLLILTAAFIAVYALIVRYTFELSIDWIDKRGMFVWLLAVVLLLGLSSSLITSLDHLWLIVVHKCGPEFRTGQILSSIAIGLSYLTLLVLLWVDGDLVTHISETRPILHSGALSTALLILAFKRFLTTIVVAE